MEMSPGVTQPVLAVIVFAVLVLAFVSGSQLLKRALITAPLAFVAAGAILGFSTDPIAGGSPEALHLLTELTLVLILFHDAAQVRPRQIDAERGLVLRLLLIGFPLTVLAGVAAGALIFDDLPFHFILLLAAALAPTDAALGAATVLNPAVPVRVRRLLNVESGLNDGLATPIVLFAVAAVAGAEGLGPAASLAGALGELALGVVIGTAVGVFGALLLRWSRERHFSVPKGRALGVAMLPVLAYTGALVASGNGFVAAFVAGTAFAGAGAWSAQEPSALELTDAFAKPMVYAVWLIFGLLAVPAIVRDLTVRDVGFALLSLTVLRMAPVAVSLIGSGLRMRTALFVGWFGPRGMASIIFALIALESLDDDTALRTVVTTIALTVLLSVIAHGLSAAPAARRYGAWISAQPGAAEVEPSLEPVSRHLHHR